MISIRSLQGRETVAYRCKNSDNVAVLTRLTQQGSNPPMGVVGNWYGFIPLGESTGTPRFVGRTFFETLKNAMDKRDVYTFTDVQEFCHWVLQLKGDIEMSMKT